MYEYGCTRCQRYHRECDPEYTPHLCWQSKHGLVWLDIYTAIVGGYLALTARLDAAERGAKRTDE